MLPVYKRVGFVCWYGDVFESIYGKKERYNRKIQINTVFLINSSQDSAICR